MKALRLVALLSLLLLLAAPVPLRAQDGEAVPDHSITYQGFSGLFNVISANTLDAGQTSFGVTHRNWDRELNDIDINDLAANFGIGIGSRLELGFSYIANRQMDFADPFSGAFYNDFPFARTDIVSGGGDMLLGLKVALVRIEKAGNGLAVFFQTKVPTADPDEGRGTGELDYTGGIAFGLVRGPVGFHAHSSYTLVGDPDLPSGAGKLDLADRVNFALGLEFGGRSAFKGIVELSGETYLREETGFLVDGVPRDQENALDLTAGFKLGGAGHGGFTLGGAYTRNLNMNAHRLSDGGDTNPNGVIGELSFTTYQRAIAPPPVPVETVERINHPPSCSLSATPKQLSPAASDKPHVASLAVQASDPDGDPLSYTWSASGGTVAGTGASATFTPPEKAVEGSYTVTVQVADGKGGETSCSETIVVKADAETFEGRVQFEFDRYDLSPEARTVIERVAQHLQRHPTLKVQVEGHCCYIATEEYNLQLGQQRAEAIRAYLASLGIAGARVSTISYGETRPWQDNSREITRRLNRRGEFRFKFTD